MTRVLLADDAAFFRATLAQFLRDEGYDVVAEVGEATTLLETVRRTRPDLAVVDVRMPPHHGLDGLDAAIRTRRAFRGTAILVLSNHVEARHAAALVGGTPRGVGYLVKDRVTGPDEFLAAVETVLAGGCVLDPQVAGQLVHTRENPAALLTRRERAVLELMAQGRSNAAIGGELSLSPKTVESHIRSIFQRLDIGDEPARHRRVMAVLAHFDQGFALQGQP
ncbi:response regulator transcription factor [Jatrophihabitans endophyticus]|uniref:response regulator transcription factor n=1 Tax=Jatrophihabitans endophyticus TaxID=1206085 RepID=UPI0019F3EC5C|nr:response regulator transcription factor [Jatrophihabitans endophyticus]MBE7189482.1 response regulator transcription factor [Jatrophihabitans endophyticus]